MKLLQKISTVVLALLLATSLPAQQNKTYDVFIPISKYIATGNVDNLSAWFADNLEISILGSSSTSSKAQAKQILKAYFDAHTPRSFNISHTASKVNMKYALGTLTAGGERFIVTIFVNYDGESYKIQQLKVDRQ